MKNTIHNYSPFSDQEKEKQMDFTENNLVNRPENQEQFGKLEVMENLSESDSDSNELPFDDAANVSDIKKDITKKLVSMHRDSTYVSGEVSPMEEEISFQLRHASDAFDLNELVMKLEALLPTDGIELRCSAEIISERENLNSYYENVDLSKEELESKLKFLAGKNPTPECLSEINLTLEKHSFDSFCDDHVNRATAIAIEQIIPENLGVNFQLDCLSEKSKTLLKDEIILLSSDEFSKKFENLIGHSPNDQTLLLQQELKLKMEIPKISHCESVFCLTPNDANSKIPLDKLINIEQRELLLTGKTTSSHPLIEEKIAAIVQSGKYPGFSGKDNISSPMEETFDLGFICFFSIEQIGVIFFFLRLFFSLRKIGFSLSVCLFKDFFYKK